MISIFLERANSVSLINGHRYSREEFAPTSFLAWADDNVDDFHGVREHSHRHRVIHERGLENDLFLYFAQSDGFTPK